MLSAAPADFVNTQADVLMDLAHVLHAARAPGMEAAIAEAISLYEAKENGIAEPCSDLWRRMFIWWDGVVNPCDSDYKSTLSVGRWSPENRSIVARDS